MKRNHKLLYLSSIFFFIIYIFSADYIFNVLIKTDQEARLVEVSLPTETQNIKFNIRKPKQVKLQWKDALFISGWVFREGVKEKERDVFLVLKGKTNTLTFKVESDTISRNDVRDHFKMGEDINRHGFELTLVRYLLKEDSYQIGFIINDSTGKYYYSSNQMLVKKDDIWSSVPASSQKKFISERKSIYVKASNKSVQHFIEKLEYTAEAININGWGFLDGVNTDDIKHYILFKKEDDIEIFDTDSQTRLDVTTHFKDSELNLDSSGFLATVPIEKLKKGLYQVGMYLVKGEEQGVMFSDRYIERIDDKSVRVITKDEYEKLLISQKKFISEKKSIPIKASNKSVQYFIDTFEYAGESVIVNGWGFLDGLNTDDIKHYILFKKGDDVEIFDTDARTRKDVTTHLKDSGLNLDSSGFLARVPIEKLEKGPCQIGVYLVKGEKQGAVFSDKYLEIKDDSTVRVITKDEFEKTVASKATRELNVTDEKAGH